MSGGGVAGRGSAALADGRRAGRNVVGIGSAGAPARADGRRAGRRVTGAGSVNVPDSAVSGCGAAAHAATRRGVRP